MSGTILSSRPPQRAPLASLGPGERLINGRVYYSAAWLGITAPFNAEAGKAALEAARGGGRSAVRPGLAD